MAILSPVYLSLPIIGDGETTTLETYLAPLFITQGLPGTLVPQRIVNATVSDGTGIECSLNGQTLVSTFATAPADLAQLRISVTLGV